jgi:hypothetical protein
MIYTPWKAFNQVKPLRGPEFNPAKIEEHTHPPGGYFANIDSRFAATLR